MWLLALQTGSDPANADREGATVRREQPWLDAQRLI
jgi:hypothetical protein